MSTVKESQRKLHNTLEKIRSFLSFGLYSYFKQWRHYDPKIGLRIKSDVTGHVRAHVVK